jgi:hypothetical protein
MAREKFFYLMGHFRCCPDLDIVEKRVLLEAVIASKSYAPNNAVGHVYRCGQVLP